MPRYDYRCEAGHKYELQQPFGSPAVHPCQKCGKEARRVLVAPPLVFKAGGFYKTESRGAAPRERDTSSSTSSDSSSSSDKSSESKPAAKQAAGEAKVTQGGKDVSSKPAKKSAD